MFHWSNDQSILAVLLAGAGTVTVPAGVMINPHQCVTGHLSLYPVGSHDVMWATFFNISKLLFIFVKTDVYIVDKVFG